VKRSIPFGDEHPIWDAQAFMASDLTGNDKKKYDLYGLIRKDIVCISLKLLAECWREEGGGRKQGACWDFHGIAPTYATWIGLSLRQKHDGCNYTTSTVLASNFGETLALLYFHCPSNYTAEFFANPIATINLGCGTLISRRLLFRLVAKANACGSFAHVTDTLFLQSLSSWSRLE